VRFLARHWQHGSEHHVVAPRGEPHELPSARQIGGQVCDRDVFNQDPHKPLAQAMREIEFFQAPARYKPGLGDEEEDHLAAARRFIKCALPPLASGNAAVGIEIEK
jgi:hypothetical protein